MIVHWVPPLNRWKRRKKSSFLQPNRAISTEVLALG